MSVGISKPVKPEHIPEHSLWVVGKPRPAFDVIVMSEESRLGREAIETAYALNQIISAGVRVFFYLENRERTLETATDKLLMSVTAFADEFEREKARQRTYDAMERKAKAGHVTGGRVFGYDNVEIIGTDGKCSDVEPRINDVEAAIIRRIFALCAAGTGYTRIAKLLNAEGAPSPRPQFDRPAGWSPSTVNEVLHRPLYRGEVLWNRSRKRDKWGQQRQHDRPAADWMAIDCEPLRIVSDAQWQATHDRIRARREAHDRWKHGDLTGSANGRGVRTRYFLTGFARCEACGGSMQAVSRLGKGGIRVFRYYCAHYWNRGAAVCANGRQADMLMADLAVHELLRTEVLQPQIIDRALDVALAQLAGDGAGSSQRVRLERDLAAVEKKLANLTDTLERGGAVPEVLEALRRRDEERRRLTRAVCGGSTMGESHCLSRRIARANLRDELNWQLGPDLTHASFRSIVMALQEYRDDLDHERLVADLERWDASVSNLLECAETLQSAMTEADGVLEINPDNHPNSRPHRYHPLLRGPVLACIDGWREWLALRSHVKEEMIRRLPLLALTPGGRPSDVRIAVLRAKVFAALAQGGVPLTKMGPSARAWQRVLQEADRIAGRVVKRREPEDTRRRTKRSSVDYGSKWKHWVREYEESQRFMIRLRRHIDCAQWD